MGGPPNRAGGNIGPPGLCIGPPGPNGPGGNAGLGGKDIGPPDGMGPPGGKEPRGGGPPLCPACCGPDELEPGRGGIICGIPGGGILGIIPGGGIPGIIPGGITEIDKKTADESQEKTES